MKRERREREVGGSERNYGWGEQNFSSVFKVPRHCSFVLHYEEFRILGYKPPVLPHRKHYSSATDP
jgi:hypothetical protein